MNITYFCKHCGKHNRQGDHRQCKKILRRQHAAEEKTLLARVRTSEQLLRDEARHAEFLATIDTPQKENN